MSSEEPFEYDDATFALMISGHMLSPAVCMLSSLCHINPGSFMSHRAGAHLAERATTEPRM